MPSQPMPQGRGRAVGANHRAGGSVRADQRGRAADARPRGRQARSKPSHGGARAGAGRKPLPEPSEDHTITFLQSHVTYLRGRNKNLTLAVRQLVESQIAAETRVGQTT